MLSKRKNKRRLTKKSKKNKIKRKYIGGSNPKIAIITAIFGGYDNLKDISPINNKDLVTWFCFTDNTEINDSLLVCTSLPEEDDLNGGSRKKTKSYKLLEERIIIPGTKRPRRVFIRHGTKYVSSTKSKTGYITLKRVLALAKAK